MCLKSASCVTLFPGNHEFSANLASKGTNMVSIVTKFKSMLKRTENKGLTRLGLNSWVGGHLQISQA